MNMAFCELLAALLALSAIPPSQGQSCSRFVSNAVCPTTVSNVVAEIPDVPDPEQCQSECLQAPECNYFTWIRFSAALNYKPACFLLRSCETTEPCGEDCEYSLTGPDLPSYPADCCYQFLSGVGCVGPHNVLAEQWASAANTCHQYCQELESCQHFQYNITDQACLLLSSCSTQSSCESCLSGGKYPALVACPAAQSQTAVLLGGFFRVLKVESWPCDLTIPDIPRMLEYRPGAAVLGSKVFLCGGDNLGIVESACDILENGVWSKGPRLVQKREYTTMNTIADMLVVIGGYDGVSHMSSVEVFQEVGSRWELADWSLSLGRSGHCAVTLSDSLMIVAGGFADGIGRLSLMEIYDVFTGEVTVLPPLIKAVDGPACSLVGTSFVISGGDDGFWTDFVAALDLSTLTWTRLSPLNFARRYHTMAVVNDVLTVFGGEGGGNASSTLETFDFTVWSAQQLTVPRTQHAMVQLPCP